VPEKYKRNPNTTCYICAKQIYKRPSALKQNNGKAYCSITCYAISNRKESPCVVCGKPILAGMNKKTCSRECANTNRKNIHYKIGRPKDKVNNYRILKNRLILQRGDTCEHCGYNKTEILQVHHKDKNRDNNDLNNLELICPNCHSEKHYLDHQVRWRSGLSRTP
jgi:hypothetical protein